MDRTRHVAFLRGINLGNRRIKMDRLRGHFEPLGFDNVTTFLASGNVVFDHPDAELPALEKKIEAHLADELGYSVMTFVRPLADLKELTKLDTVASARDDGFTPHVLFLRHDVEAHQTDALAGLESEDDSFHAAGRQVFWFRRGRLSDAGISTRDLETALGGSENTMRNLNTIQRIVSKFGD